MVYEDGSIRTLRLGKEFEAGKQSRVDLREPYNLILEYTRLIFAGLLVNDHPDTILIIGLGGGVIPGAFNKYFPESHIDVVDIDPEVLAVAEKYFLFKPGNNINAHISDGREFIGDMIEKGLYSKYDMIILDAFDSQAIPGHMITVEFLAMVDKVLKSGGVVVANVLSDNSLFHPILKTYRKVFGRCHVLLGGQAKNAILVAPEKDAPDIEKETITDRLDSLREKHHFNFSIASVARQMRWNFKTERFSKPLKD